LAGESDAEIAQLDWMIAGWSSRSASFLTHSRSFCNGELARFRPLYIATPSTTSTQRRQLLVNLVFQRGYRVRMASQESVQWPAPLVRKTFLEYFEGKQHEIGM
jgi:DNA polymerase IIIc chi subunit